MGMTIRFTYDMDEEYHTVTVTHQKSRELTGVIECGSSTGQIRTFSKNLILDCSEIFGSLILQKLLGEVKNSSWNPDSRSRTKESVPRNPKLNFIVPEDEKHKRK